MIHSLEEAQADRLVLAPAERRQAILDLMRSAAKSLAFSLFRCDDFDVYDEIAATVKRNIEVRILVTPRAHGWESKLNLMCSFLASTGAQVCRYSGPCTKYHAKYLIVDDSLAMLGSMNFTRKCFENTCDFVMLSRRPDVVTSLKGLFESDWNGSGTTLPSTDGLIVGPSQMRSRIVELLGTARSEIRIIDHRITDPAVLAVLARRAADGIQIETLGYGDLGPLISHGKLILIDRHLAVIGSASLSTPGLDLRREVAAIIEDPALVGQLNGLFETLAPYKQKVEVQVSSPQNLEEEEEED